MQFARNFTILAVVLGAHLVLTFTTPVEFTVEGRFRSLLAQVGIGISAGVPENQYNAVAEDLRNKELELMLREERIKNQENSSNRRDEGLLTMTHVMTSLLAALIAVNFIFDYKERQKNDFAFSHRTPST